MSSPVSTLSESPNFAASAPLRTRSHCSSATSAAVDELITVAGTHSLFANSISSFVSPSMTCAAVSTLPSADINTPEPTPESATSPGRLESDGFGSLVWITTTEALTRRKESRSCCVRTSWDAQTNTTTATTILNELHIDDYDDY